MDTSIFKSYDIRGIYPNQLNEADAFCIARAYAALRQQEEPGKRLTIAVGGDMRVSTPTLKAEVIRGLQTAGVDVVDVGLVSTPTFYFATAFYGYDGGIQVSASHNPKEYNGLKMVRTAGRPIGKGTGMDALRDLAMAGRFNTAEVPGTVTKNTQVMSDLVREQTKDIPCDEIRPFTIVVDAANAMGAIDVEAMFAGLPCRLIKLNFTLDGTFPVHQPDPLEPKNLLVLQEAVREHQADLGIAPDGDGDRYFFVDEHGDVVRQEILRGIMAQEALREHPGATVCYDIRPGRITRDMIEAVGGRAVVAPVGHSLIKAKMLSEDAVFGGESSGHFFYKFPFGTFEAPTAFVLKFLVWVSRQQKPLSTAVAPYKIYSHSGEINSTVASVPAVLDRIRAQYADGVLTELDGVTIEYPDFWFNVRGSNTEPLIRLNLEAKTEELMTKKRDEVLACIRSDA